jgi:hypothetical protein
MIAGRNGSAVKRTFAILAATLTDGAVVAER